MHRESGLGLVVIFILALLSLILFGHCTLNIFWFPCEVQSNISIDFLIYFGGGAVLDSTKTNYLAKHMISWNLNSF